MVRPAEAESRAAAVEAWAAAQQPQAERVAGVEVERLVVEQPQLEEASAVARMELVEASAAELLVAVEPAVEQGVEQVAALPKPAEAQAAEREEALADAPRPSHSLSTSCRDSPSAA